MADYRDQIIENLQKEIAELRHIIEMQNDIIHDLKEQLNKNSSNSSKAPSSVVLRKSLSTEKACQQE